MCAITNVKYDQMSPKLPSKEHSNARLTLFLCQFLFLQNILFLISLKKLRCGEYWFLVPPANVTLDKQLPDHQVIMITFSCRLCDHLVIMISWSKGDCAQVLLLVDKEEDERNSAVVVYVPTSHVLLHEVICCGD